MVQSRAANWRPSDQLSAVHQHVLMYFNFLIRNVTKFVINPAWKFLTVLPPQVMDTIKLSYKRMFRKDVSAEWVNISSMNVCW
jgi:hypothetical protein